MKHLIGFTWVVAVVIGIAAFASPALAWNPFASKKSNASAKDDDEDLDGLDVKTRIPLVGDFTTISGQQVIVLHGAGLVVGLDGTGEDPPPSLVRQMVLDDMKRRGVAEPQQASQVAQRRGRHRHRLSSAADPQGRTL